MTKIVQLVTAALFFAALGVSAHQQKTAISTVLFNPRTENIEIMHRFRVHDAEHAVKEIFGKQADIIGAKSTQQAFSDYVHQRFNLFDHQGQALPLSMVGYEIDGKFFWVYQETTQPTQLADLTISHNALRDLWPEQINTINVEGKGKLKTLTFSDSIELLKVTFEHE
ncbi:DUF6702 family protein [Paraglaciecola aestuariivivens]